MKYYCVASTYRNGNFEKAELSEKEMDKLPEGDVVTVYEDWFESKEKAEGYIPFLQRIDKSTQDD